MSHVLEKIARYFTRLQVLVSGCFVVSQITNFCFVVSRFRFTNYRKPRKFIASGLCCFYRKISCGKIFDKRTCNVRNSVKVFVPEVIPIIDLMQIWRLLININWISSNKEMNPIVRKSVSRLTAIHLSLIFGFFKCLPFHVCLANSSETWLCY